MSEIPFRYKNVIFGGDNINGDESGVREILIIALVYFLIIGIGASFLSGSILSGFLFSGFFIGGLSLFGYALAVCPDITGLDKKQSFVCQPLSRGTGDKEFDAMVERVQKEVAEDVIQAKKDNKRFVRKILTLGMCK